MPAETTAIPAMLLSEPDAARSLNITARTLFSIRARGEISFVRIGSRILYEPQALADFISRQRTPAKGAQ
jgi:hypothetical protein